MLKYWDTEFETMPWLEVHNYWLSELPPFIEYLRSSSPFYKSQLKSIDPRSFKSLNDMREIPLLTKNEVRESQKETSRETPLGTIQSAKTEEIRQVISSSGTSGRPVYYGVTAEDLRMWMEALSTYFYTAGVRKEDIVAHIVAVPLFAGGEPYFEAIRNIGALTVWPGGLSTTRILETVRNLHCNIIQTTVSFNLFLADQCKDVLGIDPKEMGIKIVQGGGEPGLGEEAIREKLRETWGAESVREIMGLADVLPGMWAECEEELGMHFTAQKHVLVELRDPESGELVPWETGVTGEPIYTAFHRQATPVLRYKSSDLIRVEGTSCLCGRTSPMIRCIGRVDDMLVYKAMNVFPSAIRDVIQKYFQSSTNGYMQVVKEYFSQVRFDDPIPVDVEVISLEQDLPRLKREIEGRVRDLLNVRVEVNLVAPDTLKRSQYKTPLVRVREDV